MQLVVNETWLWFEVCAVTLAYLKFKFDLLMPLSSKINRLLSKHVCVQLEHKIFGCRWVSDDSNAHWFDSRTGELQRNTNLLSMSWNLEVK